MFPQKNDTTYNFSELALFQIFFSQVILLKQ